MNYYGEEIPMTAQASAVSSTAKHYSDALINKVMILKDAPQVQQTLSDLGLQPYVKDVNKEMVKNILTAYGTYKIVMGVKNNIIKIGAVGLAFWVFTQNKEKIMMALDNINTPSTNITIDPASVS